MCACVRVYVCVCVSALASQSDRDRVCVRACMCVVRERARERERERGGRDVEKNINKCAVLNAQTSFTNVSVFLEFRKSRPCVLILYWTHTLEQCKHPGEEI